MADVDPEKREAALRLGAAAAYDPADPNARKALIRATGGGVAGAADFAGTDGSLAFAVGAIGKGGKVVLIPLDARTWDAHVPNDAPQIAKTLISRLRNGA